MPILYGDFEISKGRALTQPRVKPDGTVDFFYTPPSSRDDPLGRGMKRALGGMMILGPAPPAGPPPAGRRMVHVRRSVGVMDVGQGNCNMLIRGEHPVAYFDTGFPLWFFRKTAPENISQVVPNRPSGPIPQNAQRNLRVILSHWDWDHWRLAVRWPELQELPWTVPEQPVGPMAMNFFTGLQNPVVIPQGNEPEMVPSPSPEYQLCICHPGAGAAAAMVLNNTGLAMEAKASRPNNVEGEVLLTGDANFSSLPPMLRNKPSLVGITAVHHGSDAHGAAEQLVEPSVGTTGMIAYSYGCSPRQQGPPYHPYGFPAPAAVGKYRAKRWGRPEPDERSTAQGVEINGNHISHGNVRMGNQRTLNGPLYGECAFADFPPTHWVL